MLGHTIDLKKHSSYDEPPNKPFFVGKQKSTKESEIVAVTPQKSSVALSSSSVGISPGKRVNLQSECIDQLQKWHVLMENGDITKSQYEEMQKISDFCGNS